MPTPYETTSGRIDLTALVRIVERLRRAEADGLWLLGTGGEQQWLTGPEQDEIVRCVLPAAGALPVSVGVTAPEAAGSVATAGRFRRLGCSTVFARSPAGAAGPAAVVDLYRALLADGAPAMAYVDTSAWEDGGLDPDQLVEDLDPLWRLPLGGVKLGCRDFRLWMALATRAVAAGLHVATASGRLTLPALAAGGSGVVADDPTVAPELYVELIRCWRKGEVEQARDRQARVVELGRLISRPDVAGAKYALSALGLCDAVTRTGQLVDERRRRRIDAELIALGLRNT